MKHACPIGKASLFGFKAVSSSRQVKKMSRHMLQAEIESSIPLAKEKTVFYRECVYHRNPEWVL